MIVHKFYAELYVKPTKNAVPPCTQPEEVLTSLYRQCAEPPMGGYRFA